MAKKRPPARKATTKTATKAATQEARGPTPWPADKIERRPVSSLVPYARNSRLHSDEQVQQIAKSIQEFGWTIPVLIAEDDTIIAGHARVMAANKIGIVDIPVMVARGWSEAQKRAYVIADNQLPQNATWNEQLLRVELKDLGSLNFDLGLLGFDNIQLATFAAGIPENDPDAKAPTPPPRPTSRCGDVWILNTHRLLCGDATDAEDVRTVLGERVPNLMVTDPPYGVDYDPAWRVRAGANRSGRMGRVTNDDRIDWSEAWALFPGSVAYVWHGGLHTAPVAESLVSEGFVIRSQIIWVKDRLVLSRGDYHWQHEPCWYAVRTKGAWAGDRKQTTVWNISDRDQDADTQHSTQKPVECMRRPIQNNSKRGDAIYEPFSGSGTTIIAAEMLGRHCCAIEIDPGYTDVAVLRWQDYSKKEAVLEGDGRSFAVIAAERSQATKRRRAKPNAPSHPGKSVRREPAAAVSE